jgi:hypothetical protein
MPLTDEQKKNLTQLARLGDVLSIPDIAKIIDVPSSELSRYVASKAGRQLWEKSRAQGRLEVIANLRERALRKDGDPQLAKLVAGLTGITDTTQIEDALVPPQEVYRIIGRNRGRISMRAANGEMPRPAGPGRKYRLGDLLKIIPVMWDKLSVLREENERLRRLSGDSHIEKEEAQRQVLLEMARRRKRENDLAEGHLIPADDVRDQIQTACRIIREQATALTDELKLKLVLDGPGAQLADQCRKDFLRRFEESMRGS